MVMFSIFALCACLQVALSSPLHDQDAQTPIHAEDHSQGYKFDALLHLPGTSPYFDAIGYGLKHKAPEGCEVRAASYLVRHGAIYSNDDEYEEYIKPFLYKVEQTRGEFSGDLEFMNKWQSPILEDKLEDLTPSGARDAEKVGKHILNRYPDLVRTTKKILADKKSRTFDTARAFVKGWPHHKDIEIVRVSKKNVNGSMETLNPHKSCDAFNKKPGDKELAEFLDVYGPKVIERLSAHLPKEIKLKSKDILGFQSICGYESAITGKRSPICAVFTDAEWMAYEYAWDMKYAHMVGPLNKLSPYLGFPWLEAQTDLFRQLDSENTTDGNGWPKGQRFFLSFSHREVPPFVATALGIFNSSSNTLEQFPTTHINWGRSWKMSDLIPFLGHVGMEKMSCTRPGMTGEYIRFIANTAPRPLPRCQSGPGASCPVEEFEKIVKAGAKKYGDFDSVCKK